ncbi:MAG TPA: UDP-N-acetylmuramate dehydrogenase [Pilimelia sp.]|nr:UDP-N-acetylmuramate dehydrogenase [Pilimelia sp.]
MPDVSADTTPAAAPAGTNSLAAYTTLRLGGPAGRLVTADTEDDLVQTVRHAPGPVLLLAGGSNVVVGDRGVPGTVVLVRTRGLRFTDHPGGDATLRVAAGEPWDEVVAATVARGYAGLECLSGIPGSTGATPIQNVGAYGQEVAETITAVRAYDRVAEETVTLAPAQCAFAYRTSVFKHSDRWIVLSVDFRLTRSALSAPVRYAELARALAVGVGDRVPLARARAAVLALRAGKAMVLDDADPDTYSAGSFFTNPILDVAAYAALRDRATALGLAEPPSWPGTDGLVKVSAAWLIERAGFHRGYTRGGGVAISTRHTLALTNRGNGTTAALLELARDIRAGVHAQFGVTLHPEPVLLGCTL